MTSIVAKTHLRLHKFLSLYRRKYERQQHLRHRILHRMWSSFATIFVLHKLGRFVLNFGYIMPNKLGTKAMKKLPK